MTRRLTLDGEGGTGRPQGLARIRKAWPDAADGKVGPFLEGALSCVWRDWAEPTELYGDFGRCYERNLWIRPELIAWPDTAGIKPQAFAHGGRVQDAWGIRARRFLFRKGPQAGEVDPAKYRWW